MKHQQVVYLQEMGITCWQVRKPELFTQVETTPDFDLSRYAMLVICSEHDFANPLMNKILSAFKFSAIDVHHCSMEQFENHQGNLPEYIWSTMGPVNQVFAHKLLTSPPLSQLEKSPADKRALWEQFCAFNEQ